MLYRLFIILLVLTHFFDLKSQVNIVPNSGFELMTSCPNFGANWQVCNNWNNVNMNPGPGPWGTPDYFTACGTSGAAPPATFSGTCIPQSGVSMMGLVMYNVPFPDYREYLSAQLTCPMTAGNTYTLSFWLSNGTGIKSPYTIRNIGAHFSAAPLSQTGWGLINQVPQAEVTTNVISTGWTQYTFVVTATATWNYITFGCFRTDALNNPTMSFPNPGGPASVYANYFVDNIEVFAPGSSGSALTLTTSITQPNCGGSGSATITPSFTNNTTYLWSPGNFTTSSISNLAPGSYTVNVTGISGCATATAASQFTINSGSSLSVSVNGPVACKNQSIQISSVVNGGTPAYTYTWLPGNINTPNLFVTNSVTTTYTLITQDNTGCIGSSVFTASVANVTSNFNYSLNPCNGSFTLTNTSTGATTYNWNFGDNSSSTLSQPSHSYTSPGTYTISLIAGTANGCNDTIKKTITIGQIVQANFTAQLNMCDSIATLNNSSTGGSSYLWDYGDGTTSTLFNPANHIYTTSGTYTILLVVTGSNGCKDSITKSVTVVKNAQASFNITSFGCSKNISLLNTSSSAISNAWQFGDGNGSAISNPQHTYNLNGLYTISLIINAGTTCSATATKTIDIGGGPVAAFDFITSPCNNTVEFINTSSDLISNFWSFGDLSSSTFTSPAHNYLLPGTYQVLLIAGANTPCADTVKKFITVNPSYVIADFDFINPQLTNTANFNNTSINSDSWSWDFGDGTFSDDFNPSHDFDLIGKYYVCLVAKNKIGCADTLCKLVDVYEDWTFYVPNTFSPNEDGVNEIFYAYGTNISNFKIEIFDRWGELIFSSNSLLNGWDGTYKGVPVTDDIYAWKAGFNDYKGKSHSFTGHIQVLK